MLEKEYQNLKNEFEILRDRETEFQSKLSYVNLKDEVIKDLENMNQTLRKNYDS